MLLLIDNDQLHNEFFQPTQVEFTTISLIVQYQVTIVSKYQTFNGGNIIQIIPI